jgi:hypothetical protein
VESVCSILLLGVLQAAALGEDPVHQLVERQFKVATPEERARYEDHLKKLLAALPPRPGLAELALDEMGAWSRHMTGFLSAMDDVRPLAAAKPELQPLVLPEEYYKSAYELTLQTIEGQLERAAKGTPADPTTSQAIALQLNKLETDVTLVLQRNLSSDALPLASAESKKILNEFSGIVGHPFYGFDRPLTGEEYESVVRSLESRLREIPPVVLGSQKESPNAAEHPLFGRSSREEKSGSAAITDPKVAETAISEALHSLYQYSRLAKPFEFAQTDQLHSLESAAKQWIALSRKQNGYLLTEALRKDRKIQPPAASTSSAPMAEKPVTSGSSDGKDTDVPKALAAPVQPHPDPGSALGSRIAGVIAVLLVLGAIVWRTRGSQ